MDKPEIVNIKSERELRRWYWKKSELIILARHHHVATTGAKFDILDRIYDTIEGRKAKPVNNKPKSAFDWTKSTISLDTVITDSYKSSENVRRFMLSQIPDFKFNIAFMEWVKSNTGKKMSEAVDYYIQLRKDPTKRIIKPHNQLNQYMRDFFEANPDKSIEAARICWAYKVKQPSENGRHVYSHSDLEAL